jgi:hypothetical protein
MSAGVSLKAPLAGPAQTKRLVAPSSPSIFSTVLPITLPGSPARRALLALSRRRQDRCNVKERDRIYPEDGGRIGDVKLRGFQCTHVRTVRLIKQHREFAEHGTRLRHPSDLNAFLYNGDRALLKDQQQAGC